MDEETIPLRDHLAAMRAADARFYEERDRRYAEVAIEREKALKIKDVADRDAMGLARDAQAYRDGQANNLREQINNERGKYATKEDLTSLADKFETLVAPLSAYVAGQQGRSGGVGMSWGVIVAVVMVALAAIGLAVRFGTHP